MNRISLFLTKCHLRFSNREYKGTAAVTLPNNRIVEVVVFSAENDYMLGQSPPVGSITVHEKCFSNTGLLQYVTAHEHGHHKSWYSYLAFPALIILWPLGLLILMFGIYSSPIGAVITGSSLIIAGCLVSWFIEYKADSIAIGILGIEQVKSAHKIMENIPRPSRSWRILWFWKILSRVTRPPFSWTLAIYKYFHRDDKNRSGH